MLHVVLLLTTLLTALVQELPKGQFPEGWTVRVDGAAGHAGHVDASRDLVFVVMKPGWHITTGPSVILYQPAQSASGAYTLTSETFLFDPGTRREAYGVIFGGRALDTAEPHYSYFVIRRTGEFLIRRRTGATTVDVKPWTAHAAIRKYDDKPADRHSVQNVLAVRVAADTTTFLVNGTEVARVPTRDLDTNGIVGLRVNHQLNIHVTTLDISR